MKKLILGAVGVVLLTLGLSACGTHYTDPSMQALRYSHGLTEGGKFKECLPPGHKIVSNDKFYYYPATQRQDLWDSGNKAADHPNLTVTSKDGVQFKVAVNVGFYLNDDCDTLRKFHETIGNTRKAYFDSNGIYHQGWVNTMNYYVSPAVVNTFQDTVSQYNAADLWPATGDRKAIQEAVQTALQGNVDQLTDGSQFFNKLSVAIYSISPGSAYKTLWTDRQEAQTKAQTAQDNQKAQQAQAAADGAVKAAQASANAQAVKAAIQGFQGPGMSWAEATDAYLKSLIVQTGGNPYQPQYLVGTTK